MMKMTLYKTLATVLVVGGLLTGCYTKVELEPTVSFDLPAGWELIHKEPGYTAVTTNRASHDGLIPIVKLETSVQAAFSGDSEDAEFYINRMYENEMPENLIPGEPTPEFLELDLQSGGKLYVSIQPAEFWASEDGIPQSSLFAYAANSYVIVMYMSDRVDLYLEELDQIVRTTQIDSN